MLRRLIGDDIDVTLLLAPDLSSALADRSQLEQVVMNLVVNARDAMAGGGRITIETTEVLLEDSAFHQQSVVRGHYVMFAITDTGTGMSKETQQRLFEPFFTTKENGKGTGLGLSMTYGIVQQSKGYIWVYSEPGHGTTFRVYLPRAEGEAAAPGNQAVIPVLSNAPSETILLVEDEAGVRQLARRILISAGYNVLEAENGNNAESLFAHHTDPIDLVVTDVMMPGCGGPELIARLQLRSPGLRALFMSGHGEQSEGDRSIADGVFGFIQKPFTVSELVRNVRLALDR